MKRLGDGPGSNFMHRPELGAELKLSGPWGKLVADGTCSDVLVLATDTGITASLGLLSGDGMAPVRNWATKEAPQVSASRRAFKVVELVDDVLAQALPKSAFLASDGSVLYPLRNRLIEAGVPGESIRPECFF